MSAAPWRAWRFAHPELDRVRGRPGLALEPTGAIAMVEGDAAVRQAILLLLSTRPGERVMRPDYGCDLHRLVFSPNDDTTAGLAAHYVRSAVETWEPRVEVLHVDAGAVDADPGSLEVLLTFRVRATQRSDAIAFRLSLTGEGT
jgi:uncharacterized protein